MSNTQIIEVIKSKLMYYIKNKLELSEYQEMLKSKPLFALGQEVYCLPDDYPEEAPLMRCIVIGIALENDKWSKGWHYKLIYVHRHEEQTDYNEGVTYNLIEEGVPERKISAEVKEKKATNYEELSYFDLCECARKRKYPVDSLPYVGTEKARATVIEFLKSESEYSRPEKSEK